MAGSIKAFTIVSRRSGQTEQRYRATYRDAAGRQVSHRFRRRKDARDWLDARAAERLAGLSIDTKAGRQTLQELYDEVHDVRSYAGRTRAIHDTAWRHVPSAVRRRAISEIDAGTIDRVLAGVEAPAMRAKLQSLLSSLFTQAIAARRIAVNPAKSKGIRRTRSELQETTSKELRFLGAGDLQRLVAELPERDRAMVRLMAHVGLRPGEARGLTVGQFDPLSSELVVDRSDSGPTKTGETRTVALPAVVTEMLVAHIERFADWDPDTLVFGYIDVNNWRRRIWTPACRSVGLDGLRIVDLRHTAVAFAVAAGADIYAVQRMLGHAKPSITLDTYGHLWDTSAGQLAGRLDAAIREAWPDVPVNAEIRSIR